MRLSTVRIPPGGVWVPKVDGQVLVVAFLVHMVVGGQLARFPRGLIRQSETVFGCGVLTVGMLTLGVFSVCGGLETRLVVEPIMPVMGTAGMAFWSCGYWTLLSVNALYWSLLADRMVCDDACATLSQSTVLQVPTWIS